MKQHKSLACAREPEDGQAAYGEMIATPFGHCLHPQARLRCAPALLSMILSSLLKGLFEKVKAKC